LQRDSLRASGQKKSDCGVIFALPMRKAVGVLTPDERL